MITNFVNTIEMAYIEIRDDEERYEALISLVLTALIPSLILISGNIIQTAAKSKDYNLSDNSSLIIAGTVVFIGAKLLQRITEIAKQSINTSTTLNAAKKEVLPKNTTTLGKPKRSSFAAFRNQRKRKFSPLVSNVQEKKLRNS